MWLLYLVLWVAASDQTYHVNIASTQSLETCTLEGQRINLLMMNEYKDNDKMWFICVREKGQSLHDYHQQ